jgi:hypothetical protein
MLSEYVLQCTNGVGSNREEQKCQLKRLTLTVLDWIFRLILNRMILSTYYLIPQNVITLYFRTKYFRTWNCFRCTENLMFATLPKE